MMGLNPMVGQAIGKLQIAQGTLASMDWKRLAHDERAISYLVSAIRDDIQSAALLLEQSQPPKSGLDKVMLALSEEDELRARAKAAEAEIERLREALRLANDDAERLANVLRADAHAHFAQWRTQLEAEGVSSQEVERRSPSYERSDSRCQALAAHEARVEPAEEGE